ncbi:hypothetical protein HDU77_004188 [Chytriomyces hyalinus]|nr:hypothetical protein HDU77_004188 [Chytriomyces hyalinus]
MSIEGVATKGMSIEDMLKGMSTTRKIERFSGMSRVNLAVSNDKDATQRGWFLLALVRGVDEVCSKLGDSLNTISIICGLLLSASVPLLLSPPAHVQALSSTDAQSVGYLATITAAIILHFVVIIFNSLIVNLFNTAARRSDRLNILFNAHQFPTISYTMFTLGNFSLASAISFSVSILYGTGVGVGIFTAICLLCGAVTNFLNTTVFLKYGHVVHGWKKDQKMIDVALGDLRTWADIDNQEFVFGL